MKVNYFSLTEILDLLGNKTWHRLRDKLVGKMALHNNTLM